MYWTYGFIIGGVVVLIVAILRFAQRLRTGIVWPLLEPELVCGIVSKRHASLFVKVDRQVFETHSC